MEMDRIIALYMDDCYSRQLRPKTMQSYEQALKLVAAWLKETWQISQVEQVKDIYHKNIKMKSKNAINKVKKAR